MRKIFLPTRLLLLRNAQFLRSLLQFFPRAVSLKLSRLKSGRVPPSRDLPLERGSPGSLLSLVHGLDSLLYIVTNELYEEHTGEVRDRPVWDIIPRSNSAISFNRYINWNPTPSFLVAQNTILPSVGIGDIPVISTCVHVSLSRLTFFSHEKVWICHRIVIYRSEVGTMRSVPWIFA